MSKISARKVRTGDKVVVITGSYKGSVGEVISVKGNRAKVEGVNIMIKHKKSTNNDKGSIEKIYGFIDLSNLAHSDSSNRPIKVGFAFRDGVKYLINKKTLEEVRRV